MRRRIWWLCAILFFGFPIAAVPHTPSPPVPVTKYDGSYAWVSAGNINESFRDFNNREHRCGYIRNMGPLIIANGEAQYYLFNRDQSLNEGIVRSDGDLTMRLVATAAHNKDWSVPEISTTGRIDGNGIVRARRMSGGCDHDLVWQKTSPLPSGNKQFDGTYALVSVTQANEDNGGPGANGASQCGNRKPKSLIVTNGQARLPLFEGTVGSRGELAMREGPSGDERIINGRMDGNGTVRAREIGRGCTYDFVWQKVNE